MSGPRDPIAALRAYWQSLAGGAVPERTQLPLEPILALLPSLLLAEFEPEPFRVYYRLTGTLVDQWNRINITGRYLDQLEDEGNHGAVANLQVAYRRCREEAAPVIGTYDWPAPQGGVLKVGYGLFPLRVENEVRQCLAIEDYSALPHSYARVGLTG